MGNISVLAIDVAKSVFQLHGNDDLGNCVYKKRLSRVRLLETVVNIPPCTIVMEACGSANHWARQFQSLGFEVKLISPQFVKPFVKGNKNDQNDAEAIAEAASRPQMRFVPIKSLEQQDIQSLHRIRERYVQDRTQVANQIRGLLGEYGVVIKQGIASVRNKLPDILEDAENQLTFKIRHFLQNLLDDLKHLDKRVKAYDLEVKEIYKSSEIAQRLGEIEGVGPITATAILSLGDLSTFKNGRHFSAFLGLVPKQGSSGDKQRLGGISKRGNTYIRTILIHGARSVLLQIAKKTDVKAQWIKQLLDRRGHNRTCCALANKMARIIWALATSGEKYNIERACALCG